MRWDIFKIYSFKFFDDFVLIYPFYVLMFADFGVSPANIGVLLTVWSIAALILEMPSGVAADKYSRKHILFLAQIVRALGYTVWIFFPTFWGFLAGFILWGVKSAFTSGTYQALVYDLLKSHSKEHEYAKVTGRAKTISYIATLAASGGAALAIPFGYPFVLVLSIVAILFSAVSILFVSSAKQQESTHEREYFSILKDGFTFILREKAVSNIIIFVALVLALGGAIDEFFSIFADLTGISQSGVAIFIGAMSAASAVGSFIAYKFERLSIRFFYVLLIISGLLFWTASILLNIGSLAMLMIFSIIYAICSVVLEAKVQHLIPSGTRATISSLLGFLQVGGIAVYIGFGVIAEASGYAYAFQVFGLVVAVTGVVYLFSSFLRGDRAFS